MLYEVITIRDLRYLRSAAAIKIESHKAFGNTVGEPDGSNYVPAVRGNTGVSQPTGHGKVFFFFAADFIDGQDRASPAGELHIV